MVERVLRHHFIDQAIDNDLLGGGADTRRWSLTVVAAIALAAVVAASLLLPQASIAARLADSDAVRAFARPYRLMGIVVAMVGAGLLSCAIWSSLIFDRRDGAVLIGLPLSPASIVKAKIQALAVIVLVFSVGTQLPAAFLFGYSFSGGRFVSTVYEAAVCLLVQAAAGLFVFVFIAASQAVALLLLRPRLFLQFSAAVQTFLTAIVVGAVTYAPELFTRVSADSGLQSFVNSAPFWLAHGPLTWFLAAYELLLGGRDNTTVQQALMAAGSLGACIVITLLIYPATLQRLMQMAIEPARRATRDRTPSLMERLSQRLARDRTTRAVSAFILLSLIRSSRHRQVLAVAVGVAVAYCAPSVRRWWPHLTPPPTQPPGELLSVPIEAIFILVAGMLLAMLLPTAPGSRWVWRGVEPTRHGLRSAVRRVTFVAAVLPVVAVATPLYWMAWGPLFALWHAAVCLAIGALLIVVGTVRRTAPPCAWPFPGPGPAVVLSLAWYLGTYFVFTDWFPAREWQIFDAPATLWGALGGLVIANLLAWQIGVGKRGGVVQHAAGGV